MARYSETELVRALGVRHVHWGYYPESAQTDDTIEGLAMAQETLTQRLIDASGMRHGQRILDAGCGLGGTLLSLNRRLAGASLIGLNIEMRQLRCAQRLTSAVTGNDVQLVRANACRLPFAPASFDGVLAVECIFHFPSRLRFFREARRVLSRRGRLALSDFLAFGPAVPLLAPWVLLHSRTIRRFYGWINYCSPATFNGYRLLARATGFRLVHKEDITRNTLPTYPVLLRCLREIGHGDAEQATVLAARVSERGWVRYGLLVFEAM